MTALTAEPQDAISVDDMDDDPRLDVEAQLLCALLWAPAAEARSVTDTLTGTDFARPVYAALFVQIAALVGAGKPHDSAHVALTLSREGLTAGHHGKQLTTALADVTTLGVAGGVEHYVDAVLTQAYRRGFHAAAQSLAEAAKYLPERDLYEHMCVQGRQLRAATERLTAIRGGQL
ncbi:DNA helicase [Rhodococcus erythropolis]|nr:DNA helicase [Rhodococcus erythropolis]